MGVNAVFDQLELGDHVCCPASDAGQRWAVAAAGTASGLRNDQKVLFFVDDPDELRGFLATSVPGAERALASRQLQVRPGGTAYGPDRSFDGDQVLDFVAGEIELAGRQGYAGLRSTGDLSATARHRRDTDAVIDYECRLNALLTEGGIIAICHYDQHDFAPATWQRILATHPTALPPTGDRAMGRLRGLRDATGIRLVGEADLVNHVAFRALLASVASLPGDCRIDATGLGFADARAIGCLLRTATARIGHRTTIACTITLAELLALCGASSVPGLTVEII
jgi:hypothetical protein